MNYLKITNSATTNCPSISALGDDTYIGIDLLPKAGGIVSIICGGTNRTTVSNMDNYTANTSYYPKLSFRKSHSDTIGTKVETITVDYLGIIMFYSVNSSSNFGQSAYIKAEQTGAAGTTYIPSKIDFFISHGTSIDLRYSFGNDGTAVADVAWNTFSPVITATGRDLLAVALEDANKPVKPYKGIPVVKSDDELFDIVVEKYEEEIDKLDEEGNVVLDEKGKPVKEKIIRHKDKKVYRNHRPDEFLTQEEVDIEFEKYTKNPAKIAIASAKYLEYLTGIIDEMQAKIYEFTARRSIRRR